MSCIYCSGSVGKELYKSDDVMEGYSVSISNKQIVINAWTENYIGLGDAIIPIDYCPMCGEKLTKYA